MTYKWDIFEDGVTQSFIQKWLQCPQQAKLEYVDGWTSKGFYPSVIFGEVVHHVLGKIFATNPPKVDTIFSDIETGIDEYIKTKNLEGTDASTGELESIGVIAAKVTAILRCYFRRYHEDLKHDWQLIEKKLKVPYQVNDDTIYLNGKLDGGFYDESNFWIIDHKCMSVINLNDIFTLLPVDFQLNYYYHLYCEATKNRQSGYDPPVGFIYNIIRIPQNRKADRETFKDFQARIEEKIMEDLPHYFVRQHIRMGVVESDLWANAFLKPILERIVKWAKGNYREPPYYNPVALYNKYGLVPMTRALIEHDFAGLVKKSTPFPELEIEND